jgi:hypothetical protein
VIGWGNMVFFLADDGFYMILGGSPAIPIGAGKVDTTFLADLRTAYAYRVNAAIDPTNKLVMWAYPGTGSTDGTCNRIMVYNWAVKRWARVVDVTLEAFMRWAATGYSLDGLDSVSASLDALPDSLDSRAWVGGAQSLSAFSTDHKAYTFTGTAMDATVDTGEVQLSPRHALERHVCSAADRWQRRYGDSAHEEPSGRYGYLRKRLIARLYRPLRHALECALPLRASIDHWGVQLHTGRRIELSPLRGSANGLARYRRRERLSRRSDVRR